MAHELQCNFSPAVDSCTSTPSPHPFAHWMLREIYEQPLTLESTLLRVSDGERFRPQVCEPIREWIRAAGKSVVIAASGSSRHAGLAGELLLEENDVPQVDVEYSSEYAYQPEARPRVASMLVISQSGETADTLAALRKARRFGRQVLAITNAPASSMAREATVSFPTAAGIEYAVPATKSFTAQLLNLYLLALLTAESRRVIPAAKLKSALRNLASLPALVERQLAGWREAAESLAQKYSSAGSFLYLGRGLHYPIAREGALKLKESTYIHAEGYPAGELKHGPNALVSDQTPLVILATMDRNNPHSVQRYRKTLQLMNDMRKQGAHILAVANRGDDQVAELTPDILYVAETAEPLLAIAEVIPLQMFAYFIALSRKIDVDHPRNLSKAVLAE